MLLALLAPTAAHATDRPNIIYILEAPPQQALRLGDWKAYRPAPNKPLQLYNLAEDVGESHDLADGRPEIADKLKRLMAESRVNSPDFPLAKKGTKK